MTSVEKHGFNTNPFEAEGATSFGRTESGFDTMTKKYIGSTSSPVSFASANFPAGTALSGYSNMYITEVRAEQEGASVYSFTVEAKGLLGTQAVKRNVTTRTQSFTTGAITLPAPTGAVAQANGIYVNIACSFLQVTTLFPSTTTEPQNATPLGPLPTPPANPFDIGDITPIYNFPYGWILEGLDVDTVNGAEIYLVKQDWVYKHQFIPG